MTVDVADGDLQVGVDLADGDLVGVDRDVVGVDFTEFLAVDTETVCDLISVDFSSLF